MMLFAAVEPVSLSSNAMRGVLTKCAKVPAKAARLEIHEFITDTDPNSLVGDKRSRTDLVDVYTERNESNFRRARDLQLPPDWTTQGVYKCTLNSQWFSISMLGEHLEICLMLGIGDGQVFTFELEQNYSKVRAEIVYKFGSVTGRRKMYDLWMHAQLAT